jgi:hypothetical protein
MSETRVIVPSQQQTSATLNLRSDSSRSGLLSHNQYHPHYRLPYAEAGNHVPRTGRQLLRQTQPPANYPTTGKTSAGSRPHSDSRANTVSIPVERLTAGIFKGGHYTQVPRRREDECNRDFVPTIRAWYGPEHFAVLCRPNSGSTNRLGVFISSRYWRHVPQCCRCNPRPDRICFSSQEET